MISHEFDEANSDRKKRINITALNTAEKINQRLRQFIDDTYKNPSLTRGQKHKIRDRLLENL